MIDFTQLRGKTVAITGASRGIGKDTARLLAGLGVNLALGARGIDELNRFASAFEPSQVWTSHLDVTDESSVVRFAEETVRRFGKVDALINSAGTGVFESVLNLSAEDFDQMIQVNLRGTFLCCKYFGRRMLEFKEGKILNLVSIAGTTALPGCGGYSASKFGALGLTKVLQAELRGQGIQVTAVLPGSVDTSFWERIEHPPDRSSMMPSESLAKQIVFLLCLPSGSVVDEITIMPPLGIL